LFRLCAVLAQAIFTILSSVRVVSTAVATVPSTATEIVIIVAVAVAYEVRRATAFSEGLHASVALRNVFTVQALALFAVTIIVNATAVTAIPIATSVVIDIVAVVVTLPFFLAAGSLDDFIGARVFRSHEGTVLTLTPAFGCFDSQ